MKSVYQLVITLDDGTQFNLLYSSRKRALHDLNFRYPIGGLIDSGCEMAVVASTVIKKRVLF